MPKRRDIVRMTDEEIDAFLHARLQTMNVATYNHDVSPTTLFVLSSVLATALAAASYHFLERPIRTAPRLNRYRIPHDRSVDIAPPGSASGGGAAAPAAGRTCKQT